MSWDADQNESMFHLLKELGYDYVESVYSKFSTEFPVLAIQSIFYNSGITTLDNTEVCANHIKKIIADCKKHGIKVITFGSPTMRIGSKDKIHQLLLSVDEMLDGTDIKFCIEPNARYYGAEYYNTLEEIVQDLKEYNYKNITSMIDVGNSILEDKIPKDEYKKYKDYISHIHFAAKDLKEIKDYNLYISFYNYLVHKNYKGCITYEFSNAEDIKKCIKVFIGEINNDKYFI
ncbi:MAG: hypothetical protein EBR82_66025 [Caulobacteraceae bacterium]|nr:hypothetical protein [Caulobacteraceae bacterium]